MILDRGRRRRGASQTAFPRSAWKRGRHPRNEATYLLYYMLLLGASLAGCVRDGEEVLVASAWPESERRALATEFRRWAEARPDATGEPVRVRWIALAPGDDVARGVRRWAAPDVVLGVGRADLERLARNGWLVPVERRGHPLWCVTGRRSIGLVGRAAAVAAAAGRAPEP